MNKSFDKLKKQAWRNVLVKCVLAGVTASLWVVIAVLLPCLLCNVRLLWAWYALIALGGLGLGFGVAYAFLRFDDLKLAKRLDGELALDERAQTAYICQTRQDGIACLQRADTQAKLDAVKRLRFGNLALVIVLVVALVLGVVALPVIAVYADAGSNDGPPVDPDRPVTDWEWQALDELIEYVKSSTKADEQAKQGMVTALEGLRTVLKNGVSQSGLKAFVQNAITSINNSVGQANERDGVTEEQKSNNNSERDYVINRLNEIFGLGQNGNDPDNPSGEDKKDDKPITPGGNTGTGDLVTGGVPFFDPDKGYVSSGDPETRDKYYEVIRQAMLEGTISRSEWENIVATYFADLKDKED